VNLGWCPDQLHLGPKAYRVWADVLLPPVQEALARR
jgi:lysophospholipase L1-like esterase